jgi:hypothetical protein
MDDEDTADTNRNPKAILHPKTTDLLTPSYGRSYRDAKRIQ